MKNLPRVLIVEDNKRQAEMIAQIIEDTGFCKPVVAHNGVEAVTILKNYSRWYNPFGRGIACILLDWQMPEMSGEQFIKYLRNKESHNFLRKQIPVVIMTAYNDFARRNLATHPQNGKASGYLLKPFDELELTRLLHKIIIENKAELLKKQLYEKRVREFEEFVESIKMNRHEFFSSSSTIDGGLGKR